MRTSGSREDAWSNVRVHMTAGVYAYSYVHHRLPLLGNTPYRTADARLGERDAGT